MGKKIFSEIDEKGVNIPWLPVGGYVPPVPTFQSTDKVGHGYIPAYARVAGELGRSANVCELGVYGGGSLDVWRNKFFPNGIVAGVDITDLAFWPEGTVKIVCDQTDGKLPAVLRAISQTWDLIVDDASHNDALTRRSWELLWPLVRSGGYYIIEDWINTRMQPTAHSFIDEISATETSIASMEYWRGRDRADGLIILRKR